TGGAARSGERLLHIVERADLGIASGDARGRERREDVVLAPHDALGHAGGAARIKHVEVVTAAAPRGVASTLILVGDFLVVVGPRGALATAVVDPEPALDVGDAVLEAFDAFSEGAFEDDGDRVGVVPEVDELFVA